MCTPRYIIRVPDDLNPDRLLYIPQRAWPNPARRQLRVNFHTATQTIEFDENGKPIDLKNDISPEARIKLQSRRETPRSHMHASDE